MNQLERIIEQGNRPLGLDRIREPQPDGNIRCADGFTLSVIAGGGAYCTPRQDDGPFVAVEVGYPSEQPQPWERWVEYAESPVDPTESIYGWVPVELVRDLVDAHGGVA